MNFLPAALLVTLTAFFAAGCGTNNEDTPKKETLVCPDPATITPEDCELDISTINTQEDVFVVCSSPCTKIRSLGVSYPLPLADQNPFIRIKEVGFLRVNTYGGGTDMEEFSSIEKVRNNLSLESEPGIRSLKGLRNLREIGGWLTITRLNIETLDLPNLERIGGQTGLIVEYLPKLKSVSGFNKLKETRQISITKSKNLESINGFNAVESVNYLNIGALDSLRELRGFEQLKHTHTSLAIGDNPKLPACMAENIDKRIETRPKDNYWIDNNTGEGTCD